MVKKIKTKWVKLGTLFFKDKNTSGKKDQNLLATLRKTPKKKLNLNQIDAKEEPNKEVKEKKIFLLFSFCERKQQKETNETKK